MTLDQLTEYKMRNIFTQGMMEKLFPDPFLKNQNWVYFTIKILKFYAIFFYCMVNRGLSKYIETKLQTTLLFPHINHF